MNEHRDKPYIKWGLTALVVIFISILLVVIFTDLPGFFGVLTALEMILEPLIFGVVIAFLLNPIVRFVDSRLLPLLEQKTKWKPAFIRNLSRAAGIFLTFNIVCLGWLMFRAESMQTVSLMLHQIFENFNAAMIPQVLTGYAAVFALIAAGYILHLLPGRVDALAQRIVVHAPLVLQVLMAAAMIWCVMQIKSSDIQPFIYFQF